MSCVAGEAKRYDNGTFRKLVIVSLIMPFPQLIFPDTCVSKISANAYWTLLSWFKPCMSCIPKRLVRSFTERNLERSYAHLKHTCPDRFFFNALHAHSTCWKKIHNLITDCKTSHTPHLAMRKWLLERQCIAYFYIAVLPAVNVPRLGTILNHLCTQDSQFSRIHDYWLVCIYIE